MPQYCVTALKKDWAILCGLRLVLEHLGTSESAIITLKEYQAPLKAVWCLGANYLRCPSRP